MANNGKQLYDPLHQTYPPVKPKHEGKTATEDQSGREKFDERFFLPADHLLTRDRWWNQCRKSALIENFAFSYMSDPIVRQMFDETDTYVIIRHQQKIMILCKFRFPEEGEHFASVMRQLLTNCLITEGRHLPRTKHKELAGIMKETNDYLGIVEDASLAYKAVGYKGVLINNLPMEITTSELSALFPGTEDIWISANSDPAIMYDFPDPSTKPSLGGHDHRYAFAMYSTSEEVIEVMEKLDPAKLRYPGCPEGDYIYAINMDEVRDGGSTPFEPQDRPIFSGLGTSARRLLIVHMSDHIPIMAKLHASIATAPNKKQKADRGKKIKAMVRMIQRCYNLVEADTALRRAANLPLPETPQECHQMQMSYHRARQIVTPRMFDSYAVTEEERSKRREKDFQNKRNAEKKKLEQMKIEAPDSLLYFAKRAKYSVSDATTVKTLEAYDQPMPHPETSPPPQPPSASTGQGRGGADRGRGTGRGRGHPPPQQYGTTGQEAWPPGPIPPPSDQTRGSETPQQQYASEETWPPGPIPPPPLMSIGRGSRGRGRGFGRGRGTGQEVGHESGGYGCRGSNFSQSVDNDSTTYGSDYFEPTAPSNNSWQPPLPEEPYPEGPPPYRPPLPRGPPPPHQGPLLPIPMEPPPPGPPGNHPDLMRRPPAPRPKTLQERVSSLVSNNLGRRLGLGTDEMVEEIFDNLGVGAPPPRGRPEPYGPPPPHYDDDSQYY